MPPPITKEQYEQWLQTNKPDPSKVTQPQQQFDLGGLDFKNVQQPKNKPKVEQPVWKWSYDGTHLLIWKVDPEYGQPHHIEVTGINFWKYAQGRVYETFDDKEWEILVAPKKCRTMPLMLLTAGCLNTPARRQSM
jgi:hypothetical protein